eukprot:CAMPEP_0196999112 /NCGR_PEP_ID=MMETSP1380-20130617/4358_1 /TAXON_ID=5936 /ORGANISM="Euplotes crassus, Strain CT5" /LENGTH=223 /DNA_ID=CAMNT_0042415927 /DNA_START=22 /DNA_END=693 /DNA_ORIENTATION=+
MAKELKEMGFSEFGHNQNNGGLDTDEKPEDFNDIKIDLGQNQAEYGDKKLQMNGKGNQKAEGRHSVPSNDNINGEDNDQENFNQARLNQRADRCCNCIHIDYYQQYFDVTTQDVLQRLIFSLIPIKPKLEQAIGDNPEFYGPFWIYTTLIFLLAFAENLHNYIEVGYDEFEYDFKNFPPSLIVVYGVGFGAPLVLSLLMKWLSDVEMKFKEITCIYGYSFTSI